MLALAAPWWLLALPLPWLAWWVVIRMRGSGPLTMPEKPFAATPPCPALMHAQGDVLLGLVGNAQPRPRHAPWLWIMGCACLVIAMARPQWVESAASTYKGRDFLLALDVSGSMRAQDFIVEGATLSRLDMLKKVVNQFLSERHGDRIGLIVFADDAYTLSPLSSDMNVVRSLLNEVRHGMAGEKTALGTAIALAVKRLQNRDAKARILILLTDGSNTAGTIHPDAAITLAVEEGVRIYTVGIGSHQTVPFPRGPNEKPAYTEMPLDDDLLRRIAERTHGRYYTASSTPEIQRIISGIEQLEKIDINDDALVQHAEWYWLPLVIGLGLLLAAQLRARSEVLP